MTVTGDHSRSGGPPPPPQPFSTAELTDEILHIRSTYAGQDKKLATLGFDFEVFTRKYDVQTKKLEDQLAFLIQTSTRDPKAPPDPTVQSLTRWKIPASVATPPTGIAIEPPPKIKPEAPRFNGDNASGWIRNIQRYFNHHYTPLEDRVYLSSYLFDHPESSWLTYWEDNCRDKSWDKFLVAVKHRFDPDLYVDYVGCLATLKQTTTVEAYQSKFEDLMQKTSDVSDATLTSLFIAGLQDSIKHELLTRHPRSLNETFALTQQLAACQIHASPRTNPARQSWADRTTPTNGGFPKPALSAQPQRSIPVKKDYPIVKVSAAERADRARRGLCYWCPEKYTREHICSKKFYALMGEDDDDDDSPTETQQPDDEAESMVITGDVSSIHVIGPRLKPRAIRLLGRINGHEVSVLIDGGSTHNFIQPTVAEQLSLPVHSVSPFRVFVGNGESLRCSYACLQTPISLQGNPFDIDLFLLQVKGPDVILGVQWLQELGDVTKTIAT